MRMEELLLDIVSALRNNPELDARGLNRIVNAHSARLAGDVRFSKRQLMPYYLRVKTQDAARWQSWGIDAAIEERLLRLIQMKPRRTASGVATVTVLTKPAPCSGSCLFCPADVRMPKSYLHAEPACQRAERNWFDPYLQVTSRLFVLEQMGHSIDKVELIVLGGTFDDYPESYRLWFVKELFRALNDRGCHAANNNGAHPTDGTGLHMPDGMKAEGGPESNDKKMRAHDSAESHEPDGAEPYPSDRKGVESARRHGGGDIENDPQRDNPTARMTRYRAAGIANDDASISAETRKLQDAVTNGSLPFNDAISQRYGARSSWDVIASWQTASLACLRAEQERNERAKSRCVGLVMETRPDKLNAHGLSLLRQLGCTKVQVGVQTLDEETARRCKRPMDANEIAQAFSLLRLFGFKIHAHFMANLPGATPESDAADFRRFVTDSAFMPDEIKLYPCALIESAPLARCLDKEKWVPYPEDVLVDLLADDVAASPPFTRISRMIRDFSAGDIVAGNKKTNLRQLVENRLRERKTPVREIRFREVGTNNVELGELRLEDLRYDTAATREHFLQWVDDQDMIAGFLRLSLPHPEAVRALGSDAPIHASEAMIREVHVYGRSARLHSSGHGAQHHGLGRALVERAARIAREAGYDRLNVISAVGTREYYRGLGFRNAGLYQQRIL